MFRKSHILALFAAAFIAFSAAAPASAAPAAGSELGLLQAVNAARTAYGLRPLRLDVTLRGAARSWSGSLLRHNAFTHGDFRSRMVAFHIGGLVGENLAWGSGSFGTPRGIVAAWLASPEHRANLLKPSYNRVGIGLARGSFQGQAGTTIATADFGA